MVTSLVKLSTSGAGSGVGFAGTRREVAHADPQAGLVGQALELGLPQSDMAAVAPTAIGGDQQLRGSRIGGLPHLLPPTLHRRDSKRRRGVIDADTHPALISGH